ANGLSVASGSLSSATYGPVLSLTDPADPTAYITKYGFTAFFGAAANLHGPDNTANPYAQIASVATPPTVKDARGRTCSWVGPPACSFGNSAGFLARVGFGQVWG